MPIAGCALACVTPGAAPAMAYETVRTTTLVNMRAAPNLSGSVVGYQGNGTAPKIRCTGSGQQISDTNVWLFIDSDAPSGFGGGWLTAYYTDAVCDTYQDLHDRYGIPRCDRPAAVFGGSVYFRPGTPRATRSSRTRRTRPPRTGGPRATAPRGVPPTGPPTSTDEASPARAAGAWAGSASRTSWPFPERAARLNTVVLFDPGDLADYRSACDQAYDQDGLMAKWLSGDSGRRLLVLAGAVTRDADHPDAAGRLHQGIQQELLPRSGPPGAAPRS